MKKIEFIEFLCFLYLFYLVPRLIICLHFIFLMTGRPLTEMWPLNECVFYVQIQAARPVYSDSSLDRLW